MSDWSRNAGILGGKFLERMKVAKPSSPPDQPTFYQPQDFAIGTTIEVYTVYKHPHCQPQADTFPPLQVLKHRFTLTDADEYVLKYMEAHAEQFPMATKLPTT